MYQIMEFFFNNIILFIIILIIIYIVKEYNFLKRKVQNIQKQFTDFLDSYLITKMNEAKSLTANLLNEYKDVEEIKNELTRLLIIIEKGSTGTINEKVEASNALNKYQFSKQIAIEKYPSLKQLSSIGTFIENDKNTLNNGVKLARITYNAEAFRYNEKASSFLMQNLIKLLELNTHFVIFDQPISTMYDINFEVLQEPVQKLESLSNLNYIHKEELPKLNSNKEEQSNIKIDHTNTIIKPNIYNEDTDNIQK